MLSTGETYRDLGGDFFTTPDPAHQTRRLAAKLQPLRHNVTLTEEAAPGRANFPVRQETAVRIAAQPLAHWTSSGSPRRPSAHDRLRRRLRQSGLGVRRCRRWSEVSASRKAIEDAAKQTHAVAGRSLLARPLPPREASARAASPGIGRGAPRCPAAWAYGSSQLPKSRLISSPFRNCSTSLTLSETPPRPTMFSMWVAVRTSSLRPPNQIAPLSEYVFAFSSTRLTRSGVSVTVKCVVPVASTLSCMTDVNAPEVNVYVCIGHANTPPVTSKLSRVVAALAAWGRKSATPRTRRPARLRMAILSWGVLRVSSSPPTLSSGGLAYAPRSGSRFLTRR